MVIVEERKDPPDTITNLKKIAEILNSIYRATRDLGMKLAGMKMLDLIHHLDEGTLADREFVQQKIMELQASITELDKVELIFKPEDIQTSFEQKQTALNQASIDIHPIRQNMLDIWSMRNSGETEEDNKKIHVLINIMFKRIGTAIKKIQDYVIVFNRSSARKLRFNVKWTPLPK
jgi:hypothetical protein